MGTVDSYKQRLLGYWHSSQFAKYVVGGGINFWSGYIIFAIGYSFFHLWWLWAKLIADTLTWIMNFLYQRFFTFSNQHNLREIEHLGRYIFIESIGFVLDYAIIGGLKAIGITPYIGFFISMSFFAVWSWLWYKYWVFPEKKTVA